MDYYVSLDELEELYINGVSNIDLGVIIQEVEGLNDSFEEDIEFIEVPGRSGELIVDNQRLKSKEITITGYVDLGITSFTIKEAREVLSKWLKGGIGYKKFEFAKDELEMYAMCTQYKLKEVMKDLLEIEINLRVQGEGANESI